MRKMMGVATKEEDRNVIHYIVPLYEKFDPDTAESLYNFLHARTVESKRKLFRKTMITIDYSKIKNVNKFLTFMNSNRENLETIGKNLSINIKTTSKESYSKV